MHTRSHPCSIVELRSTTRSRHVAAALAQLDSRGLPPALVAVAELGDHALRLAEVEALLASGALVVDACRRGLGAGDACCHAHA